MKSPGVCFDCLSYFKRGAPSVLEGPSSNSLIRLDEFQRGRELIFVSMSVEGNKGKAGFFQKTGICRCDLCALLRQKSQDIERIGWLPLLISVWNNQV